MSIVIAEVKVTVQETSCLQAWLKLNNSECFLQNIHYCKPFVKPEGKNKGTANPL